MRHQQTWGPTFRTLCNKGRSKLTRRKHRVKDLQTFMCGGVAAKFDDPERLYEILRCLQNGAMSASTAGASYPREHFLDEDYR